MSSEETDYTQPETENDRLFKSEYNHVGGDTCSECDSKQELSARRDNGLTPTSTMATSPLGTRLSKMASLVTSCRLDSDCSPSK
jgi:hypothetical protein